VRVPGVVMKDKNFMPLLEEIVEPVSLADMLKDAVERCEKCRPLTPITCTRCNIWKLKNEFRELYKKMKNPSFMINLLNTLKNKRRLKILEIISNGRHSIDTIQRKLKKMGYCHSQRTIAEVYVNPLIEVGLAERNQGQYYATVFGRRLNELIKDIHEIGDILPHSSKCYEEITLYALLNKPKTYEDLEYIIPAKMVTRVLIRLRRAKLIEAAKENDYVFYFRTKRDPNKARFSPTERRVYENIPAVGISAQKLAERTRISLRRTYKYLKRLKRKKLVFTRKKLKSYALTSKGVQIATTLEEIRNLAMEALATAVALLVKDEEALGGNRWWC